MEYIWNILSSSPEGVPPHLQLCVRDCLPTSLIGSVQPLPVRSFQRVRMPDKLVLPATCLLCHDYLVRITPLVERSYTRPRSLCLETEFLQDILSMSIRTTGIHTYAFPQFTMLDTGGQQSERKKWVHCFQNSPTLIYLTSLTGRNEYLLEDNSVVNQNCSLLSYC